MSNTIIELSRKQAINAESSAVWTNTLPKPLTVNPGESISVKQSILDLNLTGQYENIQINQNINVFIEFGYYMINDGLSIQYGPAPDLSQLMEVYIARNSAPVNSMIKNNVSFVLNAGNYTPSQLASLITAKMTEIDQGIRTVTEYNKQNNYILTPASNNFRLDCQNFTIPSSDFGFNTVTSQLVPCPPGYANYYTPGTPIEVYYRWENSRQYKAQVTVETFNINTGALTFTPAIQSPNPGEGSTPINSVYVLLVLPYETRFYNQLKPVSDNDYFTCTSPRYMGANQFALEYNVNNSSRFQITLMHTSPYATDTDDSPGIKFFNTQGQADLYIEDVRTGIFFTALNPPELFSDILGFDLNSLIVVDSANYQVERILERGVNITSNYLGIDSIIGSTRTLGAIPTAPFFYKSPLTIPIVAVKDYESDDLGYFLLEITAIPTENYDTDSRTMAGIVQICSSNWDSAGFVTVYNDSSVFYTNTSSDPIILSSCRVRILNPLTKTPHIIMGPKSTIFLEKTNI